jgi:hypothetical protein
LTPPSPAVSTSKAIPPPSVECRLTFQRRPNRRRIVVLTDDRGALLAAMSTIKALLEEKGTT